MWRHDGLGELYLYAPKEQAEDLLDIPPESHANGKFGRSCKPLRLFCHWRLTRLKVGVGSYAFRLGRWTTIELEVSLNTPGERDGAFLLVVNDQPAISFDHISLRTNSSYSFSGILFEVFFGGHTDAWRSPKKQYSYFGGFQLEILEHLPT